MGTVFVIDDEEKMCEVLQIMLNEEGHEVVTFNNPIEAINRLKMRSCDLVITDIRMPQMNGMDVLKTIREIDHNLPIVIITAYGTVKQAVTAIKEYAYDYILKPFEMNEIKAVVAKAIQMQRLVKENEFLRDELKTRYNFGNIIGESKRMKDMYELIKQVAMSKSTVLIYGESGTGKELIASAIHYNSNRKDRAFVKVNCAAIPDELLESELFGHTKGAFTGAYTDRVGRFEVADSGTLFLDEVGDMSLTLQAKILRVLQNGEFERVGEIKTKKVDVRIIAATNKDLEEEIEKKAFREDLYYRLNVIPIFSPPLRDRKEDISLLVQHFLHKFNNETGKNVRDIEPSDMKLLMEYDWPGNVRELENCIERVGVLAKGNTVLSEYLSILPQLKKKKIGMEFPKGGISLEEVEKELILDTMEMTNWNQIKAAELLKIGRDALRYRLQKFGIRNKNGLFHHF
ncbi:MAG: sigma-54 dependent transcriptional regulator [bacterium]